MVLRASEKVKELNTQIRISKTAARNTISRIKEDKMEATRIIANYEDIPNPGLTPNQRLGATAGSGAAAAGASWLILDWPAFLLADMWGPALFTGMIAGGVFLVSKLKKTPFQMAVAEFGHLGLREGLIGEVIVDNRAKAYSLVKASKEVNSALIGRLAVEIGKETLEIIDGFADDPTDVQRSRSVLNRCMDQSTKILSNYAMIERRREAMDKAEFDDLFRQTETGLTTIRDALAEQHRRNLDNNTTALEVDLKVSDQLLGN